MTALLDIDPGVRPSYDAQQYHAVYVTWLCCRQAVYATHPMRGCLRCLPQTHPVRNT
jgi:hypothetical protein